MDLTQLEMIGVVEFSSTSEGELGSIATQRFTEAARRDQGLVRMMDFGASSAALGTVGEDEWSPGAFKALGKEHDVRTVLIGELTVSDVRPNISISAALESGSLTAQVDATLAVRLVETASGASIWSRSASATYSVGHVSVFGGGEIAFDATDPERAYGGLVDTLVQQVTRDFQVSWVRQ
jgi:hypothetical protein